MANVITLTNPFYNEQQGGTGIVGGAGGAGGVVGVGGSEQQHTPLFVPSASTRTNSHNSNNPYTLTQSFNLLSSSLQTALHNIITVPKQTFERTQSVSSTAGTALTVGLPSLILQPTSGIVKASAMLIGGLVPPPSTARMSSGDDAARGNDDYAPVYKDGHDGNG